MDECRIVHVENTKGRTTTENIYDIKYTIEDNVNKGVLEYLTI